MQFNIVVLGDAHVGKSAYIKRLSEGLFAFHHVENKISTTPVTYSVNNQNVTFNLIEIPTSLLETKDAKILMQKSKGVFLMFDLTNKTSFDNLAMYTKFVKTNNNNNNIPIVVLGNKTDIPNNRISPPKIKSWILNQPSTFEYVTVSARTAYHLQVPFRLLAENLSFNSSFNKN